MKTAEASMVKFHRRIGLLRTGLQPVFVMLEQRNLLNSTCVSRTKMRMNWNNGLIYLMNEVSRYHSIHRLDGDCVVYLFTPVMEVGAVVRMIGENIQPGRKGVWASWKLQVKEWYKEAQLVDKKTISKWNPPSLYLGNVKSVRSTLSFHHSLKFVKIEIHKKGGNLSRECHQREPMLKHSYQRSASPGLALKAYKSMWMLSNGPADVASIIQMIVDLQPWMMSW